jgi:WXXGXW repeat (2 copies)
MNSTKLPNRRPLKAWACAAGLCLAAMVGPGCSRTIVEAPPPPQTEIVTESPGADFVWIGGYWGWSWGHYVWIGGHWERPDHPHAIWVGPNWERHGDHYEFVKGYWR